MIPSVRQRIDPVPGRRQAMSRIAGTFALAATGGGCAIGVPASLADPPESVTAVLARADRLGVLALGEIHDHAAWHHLRLHWLRRLSARGVRFVVAMEQFDVDRQDAIDETRREGRSPDARGLAQAAGFRFRGWDWALYGPVIDWLLEAGLPLAGVNLPAAQAMRVGRGGELPPAADGPPDWRDDEESQLRREIADGHCGLLPASALAPMARAQRARDATMADAVQRAARRHGLPVVLLAGNGHVRHDLGVPRHLRALRPAGAVVSVGFVERTPSDGTSGPMSLVTSRPGSGARYDLEVHGPAQRRADPCEGLRQRFQRGGAA